MFYVLGAGSQDVRIWEGNLKINELEDPWHHVEDEDVSCTYRLVLVARFRVKGDCGGGLLPIVVLLGVWRVACFLFTGDTQKGIPLISTHEYYIICSLLHVLNTS